jgi:hypothetical protein
MLLEALLADAAGWGATGDSEPGGANAWDHMAPLDKDFKGDFAGARGLYDDAFNNAKAFTPNAQAAQVAPVTLGRTDLGVRNYQQAHAGNLAAIASGGPGGTVDPTARANLAAAGRANQAYMVSRGGANPAASMRGLVNTNAAMNQGAEAKIAQMKAQEMRAADAANISNLAAMRAGDQSAAIEAARIKASAEMANAGFRTSTGLENQNAGLYNDAFKQKALGAGAAFDMQQYENEMAKRRAALGMDVYDTGKAWRKEARDAAGEAQTLDTTGKVISLGYNAGSK